MKKFIFLVIIIIILINNNIFPQQQNVGNWDLNWNNNGNGWINGWNIGSIDRYFPLRGKVNTGWPRCALFVNDNSGWWNIMYYDSTNNNWQTIKTNHGYHTISYLLHNEEKIDYIWGQEKFIPLKIDNGNAAILYINHCQMGGVWNWKNGVLFNPNDYIFNVAKDFIWEETLLENFKICNKWYYHTTDKFIPGNFFPNTSADELLCLSDLDNGGLAKIYQVSTATTSLFTELWANSQVNYIGGWLIRPDDYFKAIDVNGDGTDELICYNIGTHVSAILKFENNQWSGIYYNTNHFGGFIMDGGSDFFVGDFDNYGKQDMMFISGFGTRREATIKKYINNNYWPDMWYNNNGYINNWYINNNNNGGDRYFVLSNAYLVSVNTVDGRAQVNKFNCNVIPPPISITPYQSPSIIYKGSSGTITCRLPNGQNPANYTWNMTQINIVGRPPNVTATISNAGVITINYPNSYSDNVKSEGTPVWRLSVTASSFWGEKTIDVVPYLSSSPYVGCPWLIVNQQDTNYSFENNLLNKSQLPENQGNFITDKYILKTKPGIFDNKIKLSIVETSIDSTIINNIKLYAVTHPLGTKLGILSDNTIVMYDSASVIENKSASLYDPENNYTNISDYIHFNNPDKTNNNNTTGDSLYHIYAEYVSRTISNPGIITYMQRGPTPVIIDPGYKDSYSGNLFINNSIGTSQIPFMRRENPDDVIIPVNPGSFTGSVDSIHIAWDKSFKIKYAAVASLIYDGFTVTEWPLVTAFHTSDGDVLENLLYTDDSYSYVSPNAYLNLEFSPSPAQGSTTSIKEYVLEINGQVIFLGSNKLGTTKVLKQYQNTIPEQYSLSQNYPNPFNPVTKIYYSIPKQGFVTLKIYDLLGREIKSLVNETKQPGNYSVDFNGSNLSSGVYFYRLESNSFTSNKSMILIK